MLNKEYNDKEQSIIKNAVNDYKKLCKVTAKGALEGDGLCLLFISEHLSMMEAIKEYIKTVEKEKCSEDFYKITTKSLYNTMALSYAKRLNYYENLLKELDK